MALPIPPHQQNRVALTRRHKTLAELPFPQPVKLRAAGKGVRNRPLLID
jgi:hypothetical protein